MALPIKLLWDHEPLYFGFKLENGTARNRHCAVVVTDDQFVPLAYTTSVVRLLPLDAARSTVVVTPDAIGNPRVIVTVDALEVAEARIVKNY